MKKRTHHSAARPTYAKTVLPGQRQTKQRELVYDIIKAAKGPLTVPEIHAQALQSMQRTGIATVYRTVKLLLDSHLIQAVIMPSGETRYESADLGHHHHFQCRTCGEVFDIHHCPKGLAPETELPGGFILQGHEITMYGLCPQCRTP